MNNQEPAAEKLEMIENNTDLSIAIKRLERKKMLMEEDIREHIHSLLESATPANILKNTLSEVEESFPLKHNLLKIALGIGAGYFSRKMIVGKSAGLVKKALGTALQFGITQFIAKKNNEYDDAKKKKSILRKLLSI